MANILKDEIWEPNTQYPSIKAELFILTRYAIRKSSWEERSPIATEEGFLAWFEERNRLFERWCLPSVAAQTKLPKKWILAFDETRRPHVERFLDRLTLGRDIIEPAWQDTSGAKPESDSRLCARRVSELLNPKSDYVITTRLDNDDAIHPDFLRIALKYCTALAHRYPQEPDMWVTFPFGAQKTNDTVSAYLYSYNPFVIRMQTREAFVSDRSAGSLHGNHTRLKETGHSHFALTNEPMWLQIIHEGNLRNREKAAHLAFERGIDLFFPPDVETLEPLTETAEGSPPSAKASS
ncbi:glycosyltransferase [Pararhizobium mangrovi]|uniref:Rhamnosyl transferase n=1 Tax=Pararhizobium mangrovi TaxID=2590452 RepID=A0A506U166_9HYPH|nr:glycosyltransferase [Pararhizobium mangrovi]TPW26359.1 hypothetical protein FJU11_14880 [Pararhizobium mangrovi]